MHVLERMRMTGGEGLGCGLQFFAQRFSLEREQMHTHTTKSNYRDQNAHLCDPEHGA